MVWNSISHGRAFKLRSINFIQDSCFNQQNYSTYNKIDGLLGKITSLGILGAKRYNQKNLKFLLPYFTQFPSNCFVNFFCL